MLAMGGMVVGLLTAGVSINADWNPTRRTLLTFSGPVALPGVTLAAGTYAFEAASPLASPNIVRVLNKQSSQVYFMAFTEPIARPDNLPSDRRVSFGESLPGIAPPITAWYPSGEAVGHRFIYARH
jgi:hypothetical protein